MSDTANLALVTAAVIVLGVGIAHSWLGERYVLSRLLRRDDLPKLLGGDWFMKRVLRFAWHLTSVAWWGLGAVLLAIALAGPASVPPVLGVVSATFLIHAAVTAASSRGKHLAWIAFLVIGLLALVPVLGSGT